MVVTYHILRSFTPEWAFVPALAIGIWVFDTRIKTVGDLMRLLYLDKKQRIRAWFTPLRTGIVAASAAVLLFLPVWPDFVQGRFLLAAEQTARVRATVPGIVADVLVEEGQNVVPGATLVRMRNLGLESQAVETHAQMVRATAEATSVALHYGDFAAADQERRRSLEDDGLSADKLNQLTVASPVSGVVVTSHPGDLLDRSVEEGGFLLELADTSRMEARVYLPEYAMQEVRTGEPVRMLLADRISPWSGVLTRISAVSAPMPKDIAVKGELQGINPPAFYLGSVYLKNDGGLRPGMTGLAKVQVGKRSLAGFGFRFGRELLQRRIW